MSDEEHLDEFGDDFQLRDGEHYSPDGIRRQSRLLAGMGSSARAFPGPSPEPEPDRMSVATAVGAAAHTPFAPPSPSTPSLAKPPTSSDPISIKSAILPDVITDTAAVSLSHSLFPDGDLGLAIGSANILQYITGTHFDMTHDSVLFTAIGKLIKPGPSSNPDEHAQVLMTIVADDFIKLLHEITPDLEEFVQKILAQNLSEKKAMLSDFSQSSPVKENKLFAIFVKCMTRLEKCEKHLQNSDSMITQLRDESIVLVERRADLDPLDGARAALTSAIEENTTRRTKIQDANKMLIQDVTAVVLSFCNRPIPSTATRFTPKPLELKENFWKHDENAKYGKEIFIAVVDYLSQDPVNYSVILACFYHCCQYQQLEGCLILPPVFAGTIDGEHRIELSLQLEQKYKDQSFMLYDYLNRNFAVMLRRMRGKRVYTGSDGNKITIHPTTDDGLMFLFQLFVFHANQTSVYKMQLRNKCEHLAGLFVHGPIQKEIDRLIPMLDDAIKFNIMVDYDLSVKALVNTLVHRSTFFQSLQGDYILNCTDDLRSNSVRSLYDLLLEVESILRQSKIPDVAIANLTADSKRQHSQALIVFADDEDVDSTDDNIDASQEHVFSASVQLKCCAHGCDEGLPESLIDSVKRKIAKDEAPIGNGQYLCADCNKKFLKSKSIKMKDGTNKVPNKYDLERIKRLKENQKKKVSASRAAASAAAADPAVVPAPQSTADTLKMHQKLMQEAAAADPSTSPAAEFSDIREEQLAAMSPADRKAFALRYVEWVKSEGIAAVGQI